jgi:hypothetical protein
MRISSECERSCAELEIETNVKGQRVGKKKKEAKGVKGENPNMRSWKVFKSLRLFTEPNAETEENKRRERGRKKERKKEIMWNANLMQQGNFIDIFLARHVSGTYAHHQEHQTLSCSIWYSALSFWMSGGLESRCVGRVYGADGRTAPSVPYTRATQRLSRPPPIQKLGAENHVLQRNI